MRHGSPSSLGWLMFAGALLACKGKESGGAGAPGAASTSTAVAASAAATPSAEPPPYAARKIPEGALDGAPWTSAFEISRTPGNAGLGFDAAQKACFDQGRALCSDTQWARACAADPELGKLESWTLTGIGGQRFVVRGGAAGCSARQVVAGGETSAARVATCCERAIGIDTGNKHIAFLRKSATRLRAYEAALFGRDVLALGREYADDVLFLGKKYGRSVLLAQHEKYYAQFPDQWTTFDTCRVAIEQDGSETVLAADCRVTFHRGGKTLVAFQRFVRGGPDTLVVRVDDAITKRMPGSPPDFEGEPEQKERIGVLLLSE